MILGLGQGKYKMSLGLFFFWPQGSADRGMSTGQKDAGATSKELPIAKRGAFSASK